MRVVAMVWLCVLVVLAGCTSTPRPPRPESPPVPTEPVAAVAPPAGEHDAAVAGWRDFAATRTPRPLVFEYPEQDASLVAPDRLPVELPTLPPTVTVELYSGPVEPPTAPPTVTVELPDGSVELPTATPEVALAAMRAAAVARPVSADLLRPVSGVVLGSERVGLDRGGDEATIPVWRFLVEGGRTLSWPALAPDAVRPWQRDATSADMMWWSIPGTDPAVIRVVLERPKSPCSDMPTHRHEPRVTETPSAVVVSLARVAVDVDVPPGTPCDQSLAWAGDEHLVRLAAPLGGRVVVDRTGAPLYWLVGRWRRP